jgi:hypothetical protein
MPTKKPSGRLRHPPNYRPVKGRVGLPVTAQWEEPELRAEIRRGR